MSTFALSVDDRKIRAFVAKQKLADELETKKAEADKSVRVAQDRYNTVKAAAVSGAGDWGPVGMAHAIVMQKTQEFERLSKLAGEATAEMQAAQKVFTEECVRAAIEQVK